MKHLLHKKAFFRLYRDNRDIVYTANEVIEVTDIHITIRDKFDNIVTFRIDEVVEAKELK